ncbi:MAG TPA: hypothetical protein VG055_24880, partial [Planctomycetaceae bacterium]|nr:hypothetical protein [Planctomycetaceae bacterium]
FPYGREGVGEAVGVDSEAPQVRVEDKFDLYTLKAMNLNGKLVSNLPNLFFNFSQESTCVYDDLGRKKLALRLGQCHRQDVFRMSQTDNNLQRIVRRRGFSRFNLSRGGLWKAKLLFLSEHSQTK